jgi:tetratricopeptide (TPR) repeat protein
MKLVFISILLGFTCFSQVNDSLLYQTQHIENDTERVNQLYKIGFDNRNIDPDMSYEFAKICEQEALKTNSAKHVAKAYNLLGVLYYKKGNFTKALNYQKQALALNQSIHNETGIAINQTNLGNIYSDINYLQLAEKSYLQALQAYNKTGNTLHVVRSLINLGVLKYNQKQYNAAIKQFEEALTYANNIGENELVASCYNNIGTIFREQNKLDSALLYLEESLKIRQLIADEFDLADSYNNIALVYIMKKNFNEASNYISLADDICTKYDYTEALLELYHTRSLLFEAQQNFEQANVWLKKHYALKDSIHHLEKTLIELEFSNNQKAVKSEKTLTNQLHSLWLLISYVIIFVSIPLFLIRYKR